MRSAWQRALRIFAIVMFLLLGASFVALSDEFVFSHWAGQGWLMGGLICLSLAYCTARAKL